jgi:hypothetical protein
MGLRPRTLWGIAPKTKKFLGRSETFRTSGGIAEIYLEVFILIGILSSIPRLAIIVLV